MPSDEPWRDEPRIPLDRLAAAVPPDLAEPLRRLHDAPDAASLVAGLFALPGVVPKDRYGTPEVRRGPLQIRVLDPFRAAQHARQLRSIEPLGVRCVPRLVGFHPAAHGVLLVTAYPDWGDAGPPEIAMEASPAAVSALWADLLKLATAGLCFFGLPAGVFRHPTSDRLVMMHFMDLTELPAEDPDEFMASSEQCLWEGLGLPYVPTYVPGDLPQPAATAPFEAEPAPPDGPYIPLDQLLASVPADLAEPLRRLHTSPDFGTLVDALFALPGASPVATDGAFEVWRGPLQIALRPPLYAAHDLALLRSFEPHAFASLPRVVGYHPAASARVVVTRFTAWGDAGAPVPAPGPTTPEAVDALWLEVLKLAAGGLALDDLPDGVSRHPSSDRLVLPFWRRLRALPADDRDPYLVGTGERLRAWLGLPPTA